MDNDTPKIVMTSHDVQLDADYAEWIAELKVRYRSAQVKAAVRVNSEKLLFNWELGRDLVQKKAEERWGAGVVEQVSLDMSSEFPESGNFSARNLWYMKQWYLFYTEESGKLKQPVSELLASDAYGTKLQLADANMSNGGKLKQAVSEFPLPFACVPWGHHIRIVQHSKTLEEALFYINYTINEGISRDTLSRVLKDDRQTELLRECRGRPAQAGRRQPDDRTPDMLRYEQGGSAVVVPGYQYPDGCGHLQQHPHQGHAAYARAAQGADDPAAAPVA